MKTLYNPALIAPSKPDHYRNWLNANYPGDVVLNHADLRDFVNAPFGHKGAWFSKMETETIPAMRKTGNPFVTRNVTKKSTTQIMGGWNYGNAVNNARVKLAEDGPVWAEDGRMAPPLDDAGNVETFVPHARKWGMRMPNEAVVVHTKKGETELKVYFEARIMRVLTSPEYFIDGILVDKEMLEAWLTESNSNAAHQGLTDETEVILRDYGIDTIRSFAWAGRKIIVNDIRTAA